MMGAGSCSHRLRPRPGLYQPLQSMSSSEGTVPAAVPADVAALHALLAPVLAETAALAAWWQHAPDGRVLARLGVAEAELAQGAVCLARVASEAGVAGAAGATAIELCVAAATQPAGPAVALAQTVAQALLEAQARAEAWRLEAERRGDAGRVASDWLWETDAEGRVVWLSETVLPLSGEPSSRELGLRVGEIYSQRTDEHAASWQRYVEARAARRPFRNLLADRELPRGRVTVSISGDPRFDEQGRFCGYRGASRDVTAELAARQDAARSRELLEQTLAGLPARVMISGPDDRVLLANGAWQAQMGETRAPGGDNWPASVRRQVAQGSYPQAKGREEEFIAWRLSLTSENPVPQEMPWRDGWVLVIDRRLPDGCVVHMSVDITERKRAEAALAAAELRWRFALEGAGEAVWDWDAATDRTYFSARWREMLGLAPEASAGGVDDWRIWARRVHPDDKRQVLTALQRHVDGHTEIYQTVHRVQHASGTYLWLRARGKAVLRDARGRALRIVGTHSDITRERQAEAEAGERRAIELASRAKSEFLSRMSHEMRTPLNALLGFTRLLQQQAVFRADYLQHMLTAGTHLHRLINDVLDVQQVEQGVLVLQRLTVDLAAMVAEVNSLLGPQAEQAGVRLGPVPDAAAFVLADPQRVRQVLLNLGGNAVKYNRAGGSVRWALTPVLLDEAAAWCVQIEDDGLGMDEQQLARLFQPFERLGRENSGIEGTGLGLVISRRLVEALGGRIGVHSRSGQGTRVQVHLPAATAPGSTPGAAAQPVLPTHTGATEGAPARRVLLVEDDSLSALLFSEALRLQPGFELRVAGSAAEALAQVGGWWPELMVIDGHLPDAKGHELLQRLRGLPGLAAVPAVMATADAMPADRDVALARGFQAHWPKPLDVRQLPAQLMALLPS
jgi:PAS domain S-box-containing protein